MRGGLPRIGLRRTSGRARIARSKDISYIDQLREHMYLEKKPRLSDACSSGNDGETFI